MGDFIEFLADSFFSGIGPSSPRGTLTFFLLFTFALASVNGWLLISQPLQEPAWAFGAIIGGILFGGGGAALSGIHLSRHQDETALAWATLLTSLSSIAVAVAAV